MELMANRTVRDGRETIFIASRRWVGKIEDLRRRNAVLMISLRKKNKNNKYFGLMMVLLLLTSVAKDTLEWG